MKRYAKPAAVLAVMLAIRSTADAQIPMPEVVSPPPVSTPGKSKPPPYSPPTSQLSWWDIVPGGKWLHSGVEQAQGYIDAETQQLNKSIPTFSTQNTGVVNQQQVRINQSFQMCAGTQWDATQYFQSCLLYDKGQVAANDAYNNWSATVADPFLKSAFAQICAVRPEALSADVRAQLSAISSAYNTHSLSSLTAVVSCRGSNAKPSDEQRIQDLTQALALVSGAQTGLGAGMVQPYRPGANTATSITTPTVTTWMGAASKSDPSLDGFVPIYRSVEPPELASIRYTKSFSPSPTGFEQKQFFLNYGDAQAYAYKARSFALHNPQTLVTAKISQVTLRLGSPYYLDGARTISFHASDLPAVNVDIAKSGGIQELETIPSGRE